MFKFGWQRTIYYTTLNAYKVSIGGTFGKIHTKQVISKMCNFESHTHLSCSSLSHDLTLIGKDLTFLVLYHCRIGFAIQIIGQS